MRTEFREYDYVVVGAGSAGCVVAGRLCADRNVRVLLMEAGPPDSRRELSIPAAWVSLFKSDLDWNYETVPQQQLNHRVIYWPRGKVLGGSSSTNAQIYLRGNRADFDEWADAGNKGWGYDDVLPYFIKSENNERGNDAYHGSRGPLHVSDVRDLHPFSQAFLKGGLEAGLARNDDFNSDRQDGIGYCQFTRRNGRRCSTSTAYLRVRPENLEIWTRTCVSRILFKNRKTIGAICHREGERIEIRARQEIILCAGTVNSPVLLMASGIGPPDHLRTHGIEIIHPLGGVGQNLQDHPVLGVRYLSPKPISLLRAKSPVNLARYLLQRRGMLACSGIEVLAHVRTRPEAPAPDLQLLLMAVLWLEQGLRSPGEHGFTIAAAALKPGSRGSITLSSNDPQAPPLIQPNYCSDSNGEDLRVLIHGIRLIRRIVASTSFDGLRGSEIAPGQDIESETSLASFVRQEVQTYYHPVGTCKMGIDTTAVVDPNLRVYGVQGLRVADASIMPTIPRANTNAATIMIAEKAADLIQEEAQQT